MSKRKQKRFETEVSINRAIDTQKERMAQLLKEAEQDDARADSLFRDAHALSLSHILEDKQHANAMTDEAKDVRKAAQDKRNSAHRIETNKLPRLKQTLAAFRTITLPGMDSEKPVVLQPKS